MKGVTNAFSVSQDEIARVLGQCLPAHKAIQAQQL